MTGTERALNRAAQVLALLLENERHRLIAFAEINVKRPCPRRKTGASARGGRRRGSQINWLAVDEDVRDARASVKEIAARHG